MTFPIRFILCETSHPGNIGAAARAMKTMGFTELVLVNPLDYPSTQAVARAAGATDVLANARVVASLDDALVGCGLVVGTSARRRSLQWPELNPRECATEVLTAAEAKSVAILFGTERAGLQNEQMDKCHALVYIPANPAYSSLNLSAAVQLIAYELNFARQDFDVQQAGEYPLASADRMERFYEHLQRIMLTTGFLNPDNPRNVMRKLRRLFNRARLDEHELQILRGLLAAVEPDTAKSGSAANGASRDSDSEQVP